MNYLNKDIVIIGLGYVGLPLAVKLSSVFNVIGYDISEDRINDLKNYYDSTKEISKKALKKLKWKSKLSIKSAVGLTVEWHQALIFKKDLLKITLQQIKNYLSKNQ